jgi:uncharacterized protein (DUF488 family)
MEIFTIGFAGSTAERFFGRLREARVERVLDIRLRNQSQLAGFAKASDLPFFLRDLCGAAYEHDLGLAPTDELLDTYRRGKPGFAWYEGEFRRLLERRNIPAALDRHAFESRTALLCSEPGPERCHRRILAEVLATAWGASVRHL